MSFDLAAKECSHTNCLKKERDRFEKALKIAKERLREADRLITDGRSVKARDGIREALAEIDRIAKEGLDE